MRVTRYTIKSITFILFLLIENFNHFFSSLSECNENCKQRAKEYENDTKNLIEQLNEKQDRIRLLEIEIKVTL
jgi:TPP-dependent 2-oxoacid decarboxylase